MNNNEMETPRCVGQALSAACKIGGVVASIAEVGDPAVLALGIASMVAEEPPVDCWRAISSGDYEGGGELAGEYLVKLGKKVIKAEAISRVAKFLFRS